MLANAGFIVAYPSMITPDSSLTTCEVSTPTRTYSMTCVVNLQSKTITVKSGGILYTGAGTKISIVLGPIKNPTTNIVSTIPSLTVTSITNAGYLIDNVKTNLVP
jgi:hypothetical protein